MQAYYYTKKRRQQATVYHEQVWQAQAPASSLLGVRDGSFIDFEPTVSMVIISTVMSFLSSSVIGICTAATSVSTHHRTEHMSVQCNKQTVTTVPDMQAEDHNPGATLTGTGELFPTNTPVHDHGNENSNGAHGWYARLSDEKRAEYNQKCHTLYPLYNSAPLNCQFPGCIYFYLS